MLNASATQLSLMIPFEAAPGATTLTVTWNSQTSSQFPVTLNTVSPALFTLQIGGSLAAALAPSGQTVSYGSPVTPNTAITLFATGLGVTNPAIATPATGATFPIGENPLAVQPGVTIGGLVSTFLAAAYAGPGEVEIAASVPAGLQGTQPVIVSSGTVNSLPVNLPIAGISRVVSNGGFGSSGVAAPGQIATVFANGLGATDQITGFPATNFVGSQVAFNGTPAPLFHLVASGGAQVPTPVEQQIDLLVPQEMPTSGTVNVALTTSTGSVSPVKYPNFPITMAAAVPGLYRIQDPGKTTRFNIIAQFAGTTWLALPASMTAALKLPACTAGTNALSLCGRPATIGDYLVIYLTGLGITTPNGDPNGKPLATSQIPPADGSVLYKTPALPVVTIGGVATTVLYSGLAPGYPGLYQLDVQVPKGVAPGDDVPVQVTMFGNADAATVSVQAQGQ